MVRRTRTSLTIIGLALTLAASSATGRPPAPGSAIANGPAALDGAAPPDAVEVAAADDAAGPQASSDDIDTDPRAASPPPDPSDGIEETPSAAERESRMLGAPNGPLSARPAEGSTDAGRRNPLAKLDPRRNEFTRVFGALVVVLGLLVLLRGFLRRVPGLLAGGGQPSGVLEILARYPVGRGQSLMILKLARRVLLVHQAGTSMHTLTEVTGEDEVASLLSRMEAGSRSRDAVRFRSALRTFQQEHEGHASSRFPPGDEAGRDRPELVDLTRRRGRGLRALVRGGRDSS
ncbi:MAG: flagellar biosynthetic protein FliO [Planctomycetota bacterium]|nr:flagellar biosynthetic protein FliO [Planctomycetota bacterium]